MLTTNTSQQKAMISRLRRVEGQIRAVQAMVERGDECAEIAQQLAAARKALDRAFFEMMGCAMAAVLESPADRGSAQE
jgi:DNA-binding FrmR family transcriptional regulator